MKGRKFTVVREFRPRLSSLRSTPLQTHRCMSKAKAWERMGQAVRGTDREGWMDGGGATDERNDSGRQRRGEGLTFPSLLYPSPATKAELLPPPLPPPPRTEGDEGEE